jgi:hypothetical protein
MASKKKLHFVPLTGPSLASRDNQANLKDKSSAGQSLTAELLASSHPDRVWRMGDIDARHNANRRQIH